MRVSIGISIAIAIAYISIIATITVTIVAVAVIIANNDATIFDHEQGQVFRQEIDILDEGITVALWALDTVIGVDGTAARLAEGVTTEYEQSRRIQGGIELGLALTAIHCLILS